MTINESQTCYEYVEPKLREASWECEPCSCYKEYYFTDGRIRPKNKRNQQGKRKFVDYLLLYRNDFPIAVVEAKRKNKTADGGLEQAIEYAELLGVKFAYSTNGKDIVEFDFLTGRQSDLDCFPTPQELWQRLQGEGEGQILPNIADKFLVPFFQFPDKQPRYYQRNAIYAAVSAILKGQKRLLLTMATGTGKTIVAFQICWQLTSIQWSSKGEVRSPRILFLADHLRWRCAIAMCW